MQASLSQPVTAKVCNVKLEHRLSTRTLEIDETSSH